MAKTPASKKNKHVLYDTTIITSTSRQATSNQGIATPWYYKNSTDIFHSPLDTRHRRMLVPRGQGHLSGDDEKTALLYREGSMRTSTPDNLSILQSVVVRGAQYNVVLVYC